MIMAGDSGTAIFFCEQLGLNRLNFCHQLLQLCERPAVTPHQSQRLHGLLREFLTSRNLRREHWQGGTRRRVLLFEPVS
jgi:hypothetical protein